MENLFNRSTDEDYYRPIRTKCAFNDNFIVYESKGDKDKKLSPKKYIDMIKSFLGDIINDHTPPPSPEKKNLQVHSRNKVIDY